MRRLFVPLLVWFAMRGPLSVPDPCASAPGSGQRAFALVKRVAGSDSLSEVTICLVSDTARLRVGGYHGELALPKTSRVVKVDRPAGGTRIENTTAPGRVSFAGVASDGVRRGAVLALTVVRRDAGDDARIRLTMIDVTDINGREVAPQFKVDSLPRLVKP